MATVHLTCILLLMVMVGIAYSDIEKDKQECANSLAGLATCLPYASGDAKAPTPDCCSGLKGVLKTTKKCLCLLVKDRNDPSLGLKINATLALGLPVTCHAPTDISECLSLLHLAPTSPDAKVFEDFVKNNQESDATASPAKGNSSTTGGQSQKQTSEGGGTRWMGVGMANFMLASVIVYLSF